MLLGQAAGPSAEHPHPRLVKHPGGEGLLHGRQPPHHILGQVAQRLRGVAGEHQRGPHLVGGELPRLLLNAVDSAWPRCITSAMTANSCARSWLSCRYRALSTSTTCDPVNAFRSSDASAAASEGPTGMSANPATASAIGSVCVSPGTTSTYHDVRQTFEQSAGVSQQALKDH